jgi:hypothetical protein
MEVILSFLSGDEGTLFRGHSFSVKLISSFCKKKGKDYLKELLGPLLRMICIEEVSLEVLKIVSSNYISVVPIISLFLLDRSIL